MKARKRKPIPAAVRKERAYLKRRDADRAARGFGPGTDPDNFDLDRAIDARVHHFIVDAKAAFIASKNTEAAIKTLEEAVVPRLDEILAQLGQVQRRVVILEQGHAKHYEQLNDHHGRLVAIEQHLKKGTP